MYHFLCNLPESKNRRQKRKKKKKQLHCSLFHKPALRSSCLQSWARLSLACEHRRTVLLVLSATPFKIDQNKNQNRSIDKVQNLGNERRYICKDPRQDSGQRNILYTRYLKKCLTQNLQRFVWRRHAGADLDEFQHGGRKPTETSVTEFCYKSVNLFFEKLINIKAILLLIHELFRQQDFLK